MSNKVIFKVEILNAATSDKISSGTYEFEIC